MFNTRYFALIAILTLAGCKFDSSESDPNAVRKAIQVGAANSANSTREFVIFYANESPVTDVMGGYYDRIDSVLEKLHAGEANSVIAKIRNSYNQDRNLFAAQVKKDIAGLRKQLCEKRTVKGGGLFIFTNELARQGKFQFCLPEPYDGSILTADLEITIPEKYKDDFRYTQSPLALASNLAAAREAIKRELQIREMPKNDHNFVWISKSHGGSDMIITPKLLHKVDVMTDGDLESHFHKIATAASYGALKFGDLKIGDLKIGDLKIGDLKFGDLKVGDLKIGDLKMGDLKFGDLKVGDLKVGDLKIGDLKLGDLKYGDLKVGDLKHGDLKVGDLKVGDLKYGDLKVGDLKYGDLKYGDLKYGDLSAESSAESEDLGITKSRLLAEIKEFGVRFPVLFFESCGSELPESLVVELHKEAKERKYMSAIGDIYTSDKYGLAFETVDYGAMPITDIFSFGHSLKNALDKIAK